MSAGLNRLWAMIVKELLSVLRDPRGRIVLVAPPIIQLVIFGFAATLEVKNVTIGVYDRDRGAWSRELVDRLAGSPNVSNLVRLDSSGAVDRAIDDQRVIAVIVFDQNFSANISAGRPAQVQALYDGRRSNATQIVNGYVGQIVAEVGGDIRPQPEPAAGGTVLTNWFNPNLDYLWFTMPSLLVTIAALSVLSVTTQSIAREKELGTYDQIMVTPLRTYEILLGKIVPALLLGLFNATLYLLLIPLAFGVPFRGSVLVFYGALLCYLPALIGVGLLISIVARTQQQAFLGMFLSVVPLILLSGFASPIDNMPSWLQTVAQIDPLKHFLVICEGIFLKGMPVGDVFSNAWPLVVIATVTLTAATSLFRYRLE